MQCEENHHECVGMLIFFFKIRIELQISREPLELLFENWLLISFYQSTFTFIYLIKIIIE